MGRRWGYRKPETQRSGCRELELRPSRKGVLPGCFFPSGAWRKSPVELSFSPVRKKCCQALSEECSETIKCGKRLETGINCTTGMEGYCWDSMERNSDKQKGASPHSLLLPSGLPRVPLLGGTNREPTAKKK